MIEYLREMILGICFWLIINLEFVFVCSLLTFSLFGAIYLQKKVSKLMTLAILVIGNIVACTAFAWIFKLWPFEVMI